MNIRKCPVCKGRGIVVVEQHPQYRVTADCGECDGTGRLPEWPVTVQKSA